MGRDICFFVVVCQNYLGFQRMIIVLKNDILGLISRRYFASTFPWVVNMRFWGSFLNGVIIMVLKISYLF